MGEHQREFAGLDQLHASKEPGEFRNGSFAGQVFPPYHGLVGGREKLMIVQSETGLFMSICRDCHAT